VDRRTGERLRFTAERVVLAAGALATPHMLLSTALEAGNPAGDAVGRYLMRHCNGIVGGAAPGSIGHPEDFRKQLGVHDLYFGDPGSDAPSGKLGAIQQLRATRIALSMLPLPASLKRALDPFLGRSAAFIVLAEDQPRPENRVTIDATRRDAYGRPIAHVHHQHTPRDRAARGWLAKRAAEILRAAGCAFTVRQPVRTFSHALGSVRMGEDPARFPVAPDGRFRGVDNLWITDGSVFPTSGAVNPSLTIAANARRIAAGIAAERAPTATKGAHRVRVPRVDRAVPLETPDA
jgi:choline dehydrogenase-like flavoprotein